MSFEGLINAILCMYCACHQNISFTDLYLIHLAYLLCVFREQTVYH